MSPPLPPPQPLPGDVAAERRATHTTVTAPARYRRQLYTPPRRFLGLHHAALHGACIGAVTSLTLAAVFAAFVHALH